MSYVGWYFERTCGLFLGLLDKLLGHQLKEGGLHPGLPPRVRRPEAGHSAAWRMHDDHIQLLDGHSLVSHFSLILILCPSHLPRCSAPERWCPLLNPARCSQFGKCLAISFASESTLAQTDNFANGFNLTFYTAAVSKIAPVITLLGNGTLGLLSSGGSVMLDNVTYLSK